MLSAASTVVARESCPSEISIGAQDEEPAISALPRKHKAMCREESASAMAGGDAAHPELKGAERRHPGIPTCLLVKNGGRINGDFDVKQDVIDAVRTGDVKKLVAKWERL